MEKVNKLCTDFANRLFWGSSPADTSNDVWSKKMGWIQQTTSVVGVKYRRDDDRKLAKENNEAK